MTSDEPPSELYKAAEVGTNLAEVGTDCISRQQAIEIVEKYFKNIGLNGDICVDGLRQLPPIQPKRETATVSVGISKGGVTMWYECAACGELVDQGDAFCSGCGRRLIHE